LLDDANATVARTTLGLGTMATQDASNVNISGGNIGPLVYLYSNANADRFYAQDDTAAPFVFSTTGTGRAVRFTNASTLYQWDLSHGSANSLVLGPSGGAASMTLNSSGTTSFGASASMTSLYLNRVNTANTGGYMWLERPETTDLVRLYVFGTGTARELRVYDDTTAAVQHAFNLATGAVTHQGAVTCTSLLSTDPAATRANLSLEPGTDVQAQDAALQSIADLATSADQMLYTTGSDTYATTAVTAFGRSLLDDANATVARTTLGLVPGTNVQTQDAALQSIADLTTSADQMLYTTGSDAYATTAVTSFGRSLLDDANATVAQATLGLVPGTDVQTQDAALQSIADLATSADQMLYTTGTDTYATTTVTAFGRSLLDDANATVARATLGVVIGTNVQTQDAALQSIADLTTSADQMLYTTGSDTYATTTVTSFGRSLLDDANATVAQATLGLVPGTNVQAQDAALQSIADLTTSADQMLYTTGSDTYATTAVTSFGRSLLDDANATVAWATLGLVPGTDIQTQDAALQSIADLTTSADQMLYTTGSDTYATTAVTAFGRSLLDDANATVAQVTLGLVPGTNVQAQDAGLQSIADLATSADQMLYTTNADTYATATLTSFGRSLLDDANASVARTTLGVVIGTNVQAQDAGLQSIADLATSADQMLYTTNTDTYATTTVTSFGRSLLDDANASVARTTLGVVIGTDVQAQDAGLQSIADLTTSANQMLYTTGSDTYATTAVTAFGRSLLDDTDAEDARVTLGLVPGTDVQAQDAALQSIADLTTSADQMLYTTGGTYSWSMCSSTDEFRV
jgi:pyruvate/2-oxoglutarate/acetoin dehydrogenase E1 component